VTIPLIDPGSSLAAIVTIATFRMKSDWGWRIPSVFQILPSIITLIFINFIRE
jgi:hypothetical protein